MTIPPAGISETDWTATPVGVRAGFVELVHQCQEQQQEIELLHGQLTTLANELASLREWIGRSSRNSSKPHSSDGPGYCFAEGFAYKPPERRKGSGRKRGGQPGHPGACPELLPIERVDEVVEHHPEACRRCGTLLQGEDPAPCSHQVIEIPPITPLTLFALLSLNTTTRVKQPADPPSMACLPQRAPGATRRRKGHPPSDLLPRHVPLDPVRSWQGLLEAGMQPAQVWPVRSEGFSALLASAVVAGPSLGQTLEESPKLYQLLNEALRRQQEGEAAVPASIICTHRHVVDLVAVAQLTICTPAGSTIPPWQS